MITKEVARSKLLFCCLQEVHYRKNGIKVISLDTDESYIFTWCGKKKRRDAAFGILVRKTADISIDKPDVAEPRFMAMNINAKGFSVRLVIG